MAIKIKEKRFRSYYGCPFFSALVDEFNFVKIEEITLHSIQKLFIFFIVYDKIKNIEIALEE